MKLINSLKKYSKSLYRYYTKSTFSFLKVIPSIVLLIIPILLSFPVFINHINDWKGIITVIILVSIFFLIEQIMLAKRSQEIDELYEENKNLKMNTEALIQTVEALPQDYLKYCFEELELTNKDRISVYILDDKNFIIIGRWAKVEPLKEVGRESYPLDEGFISKVWNGQTKNDYYHKNKLSDPTKDIEKYIQEVQEDVNIASDTIKNLSMLSRSYFVWLLRDENSQSAMGVIVIESLDLQFPHTVKELNSKLEGILSRFLSKLIDINSR